MLVKSLIIADLTPYLTHVIPCKLRNLPEADIDLIVPTIPRAARVRVRVSAHLRRGAAPYGNGCEQFPGIHTSFPCSFE